MRGVIDLVLDAHRESEVACEAQSELRRIEQQLRWSQAKADALAAARGRRASRLLLRSTRHTRAVVSQFARTVTTAYPASTAHTHEALTGTQSWPGATVMWCDVERGRAHVRERPPRGITVGR